jgi:hypothetical protein
MLFLSIAQHALKWLISQHPHMAYITLETHLLDIARNPPIRQSKVGRNARYRLLTLEGMFSMIARSVYAWSNDA